MENTNEQRARFEELISGEYEYVAPRRGQIREAVVLSISERDMVVDLGGKRDGIVLESDLDSVDQDYRDNLRVGSAIPVAITRPWDSDEIIVSLKLGLQQEDWLRAEKLVESGEIVTCEVLGTNLGGVLVRFGRLSGFVPNSHLGGPARLGRPDGIDEVKEELVGRFLPLVVIEVVQSRRRLVLSRRVAERLQRQNLIEELAAGQVRTGVVRSIVSFGAFVDLGGIDGLMHISELGWQHIEHPSDVVRVGDEIQVYVLSVDKGRQRIGLSRKRLLPDPWDEVSAQLAVGDMVRGTVTSAKPFGVFVDVGQGVHGLIKNDGSPGVNDLYDIESASGGEVSVQVLNIDYIRHRIDLRLIDDEVVAEMEPAREEEEALSGIEAPML